MIKYIVFDFGGVYFTYNHKKLMKELAKEINLPIEKVMSGWHKIVDFETGKISKSEFWKSFVKKAGKNHDAKKLNSVVLNHMKPIPKTHKLRTELKKNYKIGLLTNNTEWLGQLNSKYYFYKEFDLIINSNKVGIRKPDPKIFKLLIKKTKSKPNEIVFIDDGEAYKENTSRAGINFILFKTNKQVEKELKKLGVKLK